MEDRSLGRDAQRRGRAALPERGAQPSAYGSALWRVLELGAGTGLPGIVAATFGARVVQTDRHEAALALGRSNAERSGARLIEHRLADWTAWTDPHRCDVILGADILYAPRFHPYLRAILDVNLAPGGRLLLTDPFRPASLEPLEALERDGWRA